MMLLRKYARYFRAKTYAYNDVKRLGKIMKKISRTKQYNNKKVLFAVSLGGEIGVVRLESFLGAVLKYKGIESHFLLCDKFLTACQLCTYKVFDDDINHFIINGLSIQCIHPNQFTCDDVIYIFNCMANRFSTI